MRPLPASRIALVEYLNTRPFSEGLRISGAQHLLRFGPPSKCARWFAEDEVDISLCPVGALPGVGPYRLWGEYCIGANGPVRTVVLLSQVPLTEIRRVRLDSHSRTSNLLLGILAEKYWKRAWDYYSDSGTSSPEAALMIGDKVFAAEADYPYRYDLAEAWTALTGLPMVFAVWIAKPAVPEILLDELNDDFALGMRWVASKPAELNSDELHYLQQSIAYTFGPSQHEAMDLYLRWSGESAIARALPVFSRS